MGKHYAKKVKMAKGTCWMGQQFHEFFFNLLKSKLNITF